MSFLTGQWRPVSLRVKAKDLTRIHKALLDLCPLPSPLALWPQLLPLSAFLRSHSGLLALPRACHAKHGALPDGPSAWDAFPRYLLKAVPPSRPPGLCLNVVFSQRAAYISPHGKQYLFSPTPPPTLLDRICLLAVFFPPLTCKLHEDRASVLLPGNRYLLEECLACRDIQYLFVAWFNILGSKKGVKNTQVGMWVITEF